MSSFDKVVKLACKPKPAPPKAKYLDTIIAATWSDDGAVHDVCKALSPRFREPNAVVVFKALIVLHTMIRNGATDNVLGYLSSSEVLRLRNVSAGNWEGYAAPENLQNYARYLDSRIRAYHDLKHDAIRVQAENNRDLRNSASIEEDTYRARRNKSPPSSSATLTAGPTRSKTIMGRKLRVMTVEKGLLRETKAVHRMIDALVECRFYLDDLEDELTITALRMLVKDLLILFQAGNEGVINVLEHYFEMSHIDATEALAIYRHFCKQTERVVEFLGVAKKLQNLLNVPIPNLKHAPVSLAGALQEYLEDPAFEQNRIEYKASKSVADNGSRKPLTTTNEKPSDKAMPSKDPAPVQSTSQASTSNSASTPAAPAAAHKDVLDFFATIEEEQPTIFNPQTNSPNTAYFQQNQSTTNPFGQIQITGQPFIQAQQTGFLQPQHTAFQMPSTNPFGLSPQSQQPQSSGHRPFSTFLPQATGFPQQQQPQATPFGQPQSSGFTSLQIPQQTGFLQPQATGANPFRQSMLFPQTTGMAMFGVVAAAGASVQGAQNPFPASGHNQSQSLGFSQAQIPQSGNSFASPFAQEQNPSSANQQTAANLPPRPSSTPLTSFASTSNTATAPPVAQPVKSHQTGTKNPFGPIAAAAPPPVPKPPTLMELSMGVGGQSLQQSSQQQQQQPQSQQFGASGFNAFNAGALGPGATDISSVASSFAFNKPNLNAAGATNAQQPSSSGFSSPTGALNAQATATSTGSTFIDSLFSSPLATGTTNISSVPSIAPVKPQMTGFAGLKPFKPSSSFGASLLEALPSIPGSSPATPAAHSNPTTPGTATDGTSGFPSFGGQVGLTTSSFTNSSLGSFGTGSSVGQGLRPQITGEGAANPFRASILSNGTPGFNQAPPPLPGFPTSATGSTSFGSNLFGTNAFGSASAFGQSQQQQPQSGASLI
ncbi:hypothetical protein DXG03_007766 [Asterophora parasitica]|uniref:ENTH domain-containing protein n=1 Tax=Asterophora parasitica TaxID=117018 RepID=A0A9P7GIU6_9AGAR|nr:hypothetical protein DXG03_007766 [Asterophora parasitica]